MEKVFLSFRSLGVSGRFSAASKGQLLPPCNIFTGPGPLGALVGGYSDAEWLYDEAAEGRRNGWVIQFMAKVQNRHYSSL